jgi:murein DD-endopeptidase MepM/ murein hydrolase activator NlpD
MTRWLFVIALLLIICRVEMRGEDTKIELSLPTDNDVIFRGGGPKFYQYIEREFHGVKSTPWEGGRYGFVRDPVPTADGLIYSRFHEGIDIRPVLRDVRGEPVDEVRAIAYGKVVYTNRVPRYSNYGCYIVIEHIWDGSPYYSLYGHLSEIAVMPGQIVHRRERLGRMGHTGEAVNLARAHLHLELNLMLSRNFEAWYDHFVPREPNHHGLYNGINLAGIDIARFFLAYEKRPNLTVPQFLADEEAFYRVTVPDSPNFQLRKLYPWMVKNITAGARSWEVSFARSGVPLKIEARAQPVGQPTLAYVKKSAVNYTYLTRGEIAGRGEHPHLTESGMRLMRLLTFPD